jgi:hypothetical protein
MSHGTCGARNCANVDPPSPPPQPPTLAELMQTVVEKLVVAN